MAANLVRRSASELDVKVELTISAKDLLNIDVASKTDPVCVLYVQMQGSQEWQEHARTEVLQNNLNPSLASKILIDYRFEEHQKLKFKILDSHSPVLDTHVLGEAECSLGEIVSAGNYAKPLSLPGHGMQRNQLNVKVEEVETNKEEMYFVFSGQNVKKSGTISNPSPFLAIYKDGQLVYRSPFLKDNLNPRWPKFTVPVRSLRATSGEDISLSLKMFDYNVDGNHKLMGETTVKTSEILRAPSTFPLYDKVFGKNGAKLNLHEAVVKKSYSFLDYITGGTQLNCTVAIDFTSSNGAPSQPNSLHYLGLNRTLYEQALQSVVTIIQDYDHDKQFPVLGFGAKIPPKGVVSHEFFVNLTPNPNCNGVAGVIEAYRKCLPLVQLYGPTNFAPVINHVARFAASLPNGDHYFILLILTDGAISDMNDTKQAIISASQLPMSIIIVGIGEENFSSMKELDSDNGMLSASGRTASRDIVQFVAFRDFLNQPDKLKASCDLARALLAEIPDQLVSYMKFKNIVPKRRSS